MYICIYIWIYVYIHTAHSNLLERDTHGGPRINAACALPCVPPPRFQAPSLAVPLSLPHPLLISLSASPALFLAIPLSLPHTILLPPDRACRPCDVRHPHPPRFVGYSISESFTGYLCQANKPHFDFWKGVNLKAKAIIWP